VSIIETYGTYNWLTVNLGPSCTVHFWDPETTRFKFVAADSEDLVILACTVLIQSQSTMDRQTERQTVRQTPQQQLRCVKHYILSRVKNRAVLNFAHFDLLVCIVALAYRSIHTVWDWSVCTAASLIQYIAQCRKKWHS